MRTSEAVLVLARRTRSDRMLRRVLVALCAFFSLTVSAAAYAGDCDQLPMLMRPANQHDIVQDLRDLVKNDAALNRQFNAALTDPVRAKDNYFAEDGAAKLYALFSVWHKYLPLERTVADYYLQFNELFFQIKDRAARPDDPANLVAIPAAQALLHNAQFSAWLKRYVLSQGDYLDSPDSGRAVRCWLGNRKIDMSQYRVPDGGFRSFNDFFTRELKPGLRPVAGQLDPAVLVAPADCQLSPVVRQLTTSTELSVKQEFLNVAQLLNGDSHANEFLGGDALVCVLQIENYHHMHSPIDGTVIATQMVDGQYFGEPLGPGLLTKNRRGFILVDTQRFGLVGIVPVGIATISSLHISVKPHDVLLKGDEMGYFKYGGSVIVMLFQKDRLHLEPFRHMGERLGTMNPTGP